MAKREITGKAVIYTAEGAKIVDAEVRRFFNVHQDSCDVRHFKYPGEYILVGCARTVPTDDIYAQPAFHPERIDLAYQFATSKFFRLMLDFMRLAQWEPIHRANCSIEDFFDNYVSEHNGYPAQDDASIYERYGFTLEMIKFTEERYR